MKAQLKAASKRVAAELPKRTDSVLPRGAHASSGRASELQPELGNQAIQALMRSTGLHAKLAVGRPDDPLEEEADRVADRVMRMPGPGLQGKCACAAAGGASGECDECRNKRIEEAGEQSVVRRRLARSSGGFEAPSIVHQALGSAGRPLDSATRSDMEGRFDYDFSAVRIHTDGQAANSARSIGALAYTVGNDIAFGEGQYTPHSDAGRRLLAHELAHVTKSGSLRGIREPLELRRQSDPSPTPPPSAEQPLPDAGLGPAAPTTAPADTPGATPTATQGDLPFVPAYRGKTLSADPIQMRSVLEGVAAQGGLGAAMQFVNELSNPPADSHEPFVAFMLAGGGFSNMAQTIIETAETQYLALAGDWHQFVRTFDEAAVGQTGDILLQSEARIRAEQLRYGIVSKRDAVQGFAPFADPAAQKGLANAAGALAAKRRMLDDLIVQQQGLMREVVVDLEFGTTITEVPQENQAQYDSIGEQIKAARVEVDHVRAENEGNFPILAAYAAEGKANTAALAAIAANPIGGEGAASLTRAVDDRLDNIAAVRNGLDNDRVDVWRSPVIVGGTKRKLGVEPGSWQDRAVEDRRNEGKPFGLEDALFTAVAIGLGLIAAIPTAGASFGVAVAVATAEAATVGISAYGVASALQEYQLEKAQTGTDFDKAQAISQQDPSLLWLGVSIVGLALDVKDSARIFSEVAPIIRRTLAAETEQAFKQGLEQLASDPAAKQIPDVIERVKTRYGSAEEVAEREKGAAARVAQKEALTEVESHVLAEALGESGHTIKVTAGGWLVRCSECAMLRLYYAEELVGSPEFRGRLQAAEDLAARASAAAKQTGGEAEAKSLAEQSRQMADALAADIDKSRRARIVEQPRLRTRRDKVKLTLDSTELSSALKKVESTLGKTGLEPDAITRILQKSPNVNQMRGQLVEELHAGAVKKALATPAGRKTLLGKTVSGDLQFIDGYRIHAADSHKRLITDGVVGILDRENGTLHIVAISEAKAGRMSAEGLTTRLSRISKAEREELRRIAIEDVADGTAPAGMSVDDYFAELQKDYVQAESGGQPRSVLERLTGVEVNGTNELSPEELAPELIVDGQRVRVQMEKPRFLIATPSNVDVASVPDVLKAQGITAKLRPVDMTEEDVTTIFEPVDTLVDEALNAAKATP
ncbi:DUF4157 domain-containing protein [Paraburkholderia sp. MM5477-R1]|uniref:eCIS core domain-containing protein n=1 Tax=Paraburkholderia sp. MM5477-R1 TaxID=2991062 RepID=UPI003D210FFA